MLGFFAADLQADREIVGEVVAANGQNSRVRHRTFEEDDQFRGACADVGDADAKLALVGAEHSFG